MGTTVEHDFSNLAWFTDDMLKAGDLWRKKMTTAMYDAVAQVDKEMAQYPMAEHWTRREVYGTPFKTERQRRWFFAALSSGELVVPYPRTGELRESWNSLVIEEGDTIQGKNWTESPYVRYVQDLEHQSMMLTYWQTLQEVVERVGPDLQKIFEKAQEEFEVEVFGGNP